MEVLMITNSLYAKLQGRTSRGNQADEWQMLDWNDGSGEQRMVGNKEQQGTKNGGEQKWWMAGNRNNEWQGTTKNGERRMQETMNTGNDEQQGTGMMNGVAMSGSTPPSLQMQDSGAVLFSFSFLFSFYYSPSSYTAPLQATARRVFIYLFYFIYIIKFSYCEKTGGKPVKTGFLDHNQTD
jgi:hypothetical protein